MEQTMNKPTYEELQSIRDNYDKIQQCQCCGGKGREPRCHISSIFGTKLCHHCNGRRRVITNEVQTDYDMAMEELSLYWEAEDYVDILEKYTGDEDFNKKVEEVKAYRKGNK